MSSIAYLSSFGTSPTLTLHNGTTHKAGAIVEKSALAQIDYVLLPNKTIYDPNGSAQAPRVPDVVVGTVMITLANKAAVVAEFEAMCGHVGKRATLTATKISSGTVTCGARLEQVENISPFPTDIDNIIEVRLTFRPLTVWA